VVIHIDTVCPESVINLVLLGSLELLRGQLLP
jgi:hypothetical protein